MSIVDLKIRALFLKEIFFDFLNFSASFFIILGFIIWMIGEFKILNSYQLHGKYLIVIGLLIGIFCIYRTWICAEWDAREIQIKHQERMKQLE